MNILYVAPSNSIHTKRWINRASKNGINCYLYDQIKIWEKNNGRVEIFAVIPKKYEKEWLKKTNRIFSYSSNVGRQPRRLEFYELFSNSARTQCYSRNY